MSYQTILDRINGKVKSLYPLQAKALFFDNKKMMQKNQICDGVVFKFRRKSKKYYEDEFKVKITVKNNCCHMKFFEYTEEVDIQNVLHFLYPNIGKLPALKCN